MLLSFTEFFLSLIKLSAYILDVLLGFTGFRLDDTSLNDKYGPLFRSHRSVTEFYRVFSKFDKSRSSLIGHSSYPVLLGFTGFRRANQNDDFRFH